MGLLKLMLVLEISYLQSWCWWRIYLSRRLSFDAVLEDRVIISSMSLVAVGVVVESVRDVIYIPVQA